MDNYKYIDLETFEVLDNCPSYIHCDKDIVDIIVILNKKGYRTKASCAGHNKLDYTGEEYSESISKLDELEKTSFYRITRVDKDKVYFKGETIGCSTYVLFDKKYDFPFIPEGYLYDEKNFSISKMIGYYIDEECNNRKSDYEIEKELENNRKILKEWALSLNELNEVNDKRIKKL